MGRPTTRRPAPPPAAPPAPPAPAPRRSVDRSDWYVVQLLEGQVFAIDGMTFTRCPGLVDPQTAWLLKQTGKFEITPIAQHRAAFARPDALAA